MTFNRAWGYMPISPDWRSEREVLDMLQTATAGQGNLLLNIGPKPDGSVPIEAVDRLTAVGAWIEQNGEAIYGQVDRAGRDRIEWLPTGRWTIKGNNAYFWCNRWPGRELAIGGLRTKVNRASFLADGTPITFEQSDNRLVLKNLPYHDPDPIAGVTVIKLECDGPPEQRLGAGYVLLD